MKKNKGSNNKRNIVLIVIAISVLVVTVIGATYAYFVSSSDNFTGINAIANIDNSVSSFTARGNTIELNITADNMQQINQNNVVATDTKNLSISYLSGIEENLSCSYDIYYKWNSNSDAYTITDANKNEFTYAVSLDGSDVVSETNFVASSNTNPQKIYSGLISNASTTIATTQDYSITSKFYNIDADQKNNANKTWKIEFYVDNVVCGAVYSLAGTVLDNTDNPVGEGVIVAYSDPKYISINNNGSVELTLPQGNHTLYYVSNKTVNELKSMTQEQIEALSNVGKVVINTSSVGDVVTFDNNYKISNVVLNVLSLTYPITITEQDENGTSLGSRTESCTYGQSATIAPTDHNGYNSPSSQTISCNKTNNITFTYQKNTVDVTITEKNESGTTLGTRTETCTYGESAKITPRAISGYGMPNSQTITCGETDSITFIYKLPVNLLTMLQNKVASQDVVEAGENGNLQKQTVSVTQNSTLKINSSSYTNIIYTGANPDNFIMYNGEMWRIIGVFNEDSHGIANTRLVKIVRNESLGKLIYDEKERARGSSIWNYNYGGSNEWSDSHLMFMLNGEGAINKGKLYNGNTYTFSTTKVNGDDIEASQNGGAYYGIWDKSRGSYLSYDTNGNSLTNSIVYTSAYNVIDSYSNKTATLAKTLSQSAQSLIQEVTWHLGGTSSGFGAYTYPRTAYSDERSAKVYGGTDTSSSSSSTTSISRSVMWTGKVGLIYLSDYGYAVGGTTSNRNSCLENRINRWSNSSNCYTNDWLLYLGATTTQGTASSPWSITPSDSSARDIFYITSSPDAAGVYVPHDVRPSLYLVSSAIVTGEGSYENPYILTVSN